MCKWKRNGSVHSHEALWRTSETALDMADIQHETIRPDHLAIHSLLTGFFAFEGFLNFIGEAVAPKVWENEREFFSSNKYRGVEGKVEYLFSLFPEVRLEKGNNPYQTFKKIKSLRDDLVHSRVERFEEISESKFPSFELCWEPYDDPKLARVSLEEIKKLAEIIRLEAVKLRNDEYKTHHIYYSAFEGPLGSSEGVREKQ